MVAAASLLPVHPPRPEEEQRILLPNVPWAAYVVLRELFCLERDIPLFGYGSTTFRQEEKGRGLEPDECYARGEDKDIPDLALEVVVTRSSIDKLEVYRGLRAFRDELRGAV